MTLYLFLEVFDKFHKKIENTEEDDEDYGIGHGTGLLQENTNEKKKCCLNG